MNILLGFTLQQVTKHWALLGLISRLTELFNFFFNKTGSEQCTSITFT